MARNSNSNLPSDFKGDKDGKDKEGKDDATAEKKKDGEAMEVSEGG